VFCLIRWTNDSFVSEAPVVTTILVIMATMALATHLIGVHTVLGAFVAGILIGESPILTRHIDEQLRGLVVALFMPIFFSVAGFIFFTAAMWSGTVNGIASPLPNLAGMECCVSTRVRSLDCHRSSRGAVCPGAWPPV